MLFDAAHLCGLIAGRAWPQPLDEGAHLMTFSTYKSLGGPAGGAVVTNDAVLAERLDAIAYPGLTANFDAGRTAALAVTMLDWKVGRPGVRGGHGGDRGPAGRRTGRGGPAVFAPRGHRSHQFALRAQRWGGGQHAARRLRQANLLACGIGLPDTPVDGDVNGLRIGTPELVRRGMTPADMPALADLIARGLDGDPARVAPEVSAWRKQFTGVHFTADDSTGRGSP